jgi:hypothetical protein
MLEMPVKTRDQKYYNSHLREHRPVSWKAPDSYVEELKERASFAKREVKLTREMKNFAIHHLANEARHLASGANARQMFNVGGKASHSGIAAPLGVRGIIGEFYRRVEDTPLPQWPSLLGWHNSSNQERETYRAMTDQYGFRLWQGERKPREKSVEEYFIKNEVFEISDEFSSDDFRRDKTGQIMARVGDMSLRARQHWQEIVTDLIEANSVGWDSVAFFAGSGTPHNNGQSGNVINAATATQIPALDIATPNNPTQTEMERAIAAAISYMRSWKDYAGYPVNGQAGQFLLLVPITLEAAALAATRNSLVLAGEMSVLFAQNARLTVACNPFFSLANNADRDFYLFRMDTAARGVILQEEVGILATALGLGSEFETLNRKVFFGAETVRNVGWGNFYSGLKCTFS